MAELKVLKAPDSTPVGDNFVKLFLAGSIEMGKAEDWQTEITRMINDEFRDTDTNICIFNPRRDDWDSSWEQSIENAQFSEQVNWELDRLEEADIVLLYFDPNTKSPISLLELGMFASKGQNMIVCCPDGFWRKGNVDIVCDRNHCSVFINKKDWFNEIITRISVTSVMKGR